MAADGEDGARGRGGDRPTVTDRPAIGLIADHRPADFGAWREVDVNLVWSHYVDAIAAAGGSAIVAPTEEHLVGAPELLLDRVDGLLLTGGRDIVAATYRAEAHPANEPGDPVRDAVELAVARLALERELPILAVCRGMQLLNLIAGGGIEQHLDDPEGLHRGPPGEFVSHPLEVTSGSRLEAIVGADPEPVRSHHHQALAALGAGLNATARAPDGLVEAFEREGAPFCLAVLWHPEEDLAGGGLALYEALVGAASERRARLSA